MAEKVFISYRCDDSRYQARDIHKAFCQVIPRDHVFMDVDTIPPGANFRKILQGWVNQCEVLLALIGPGWINARDPKTKRRRLDNPSDFVRVEIGEALARDIPVVPVLIDGTPMPNVDLLPDDLKELVDRQAEFVEYRTFDTDVERLIRKLRLRQDGIGLPQQPTPAPVIASSDDRYRAEGRIKVDATTVYGAPEGWFLPGNGKVEWFKDHEMGPEMVVVPAGSFMMGTAETDPYYDEAYSEVPQRLVTIARPFAIGRHAVTRGQFAAFVKDTGYRTKRGAYPRGHEDGKLDPQASWRNPGFPQDDRHPAVCVSWKEAKAFAGWLSRRSGQEYRLLSEAEWEYAARAGTATPFWWGSTITTEANYGSKGTVPVGEFAANPWGLYQVHGNVWEWCEDTWRRNYEGAPSDGSAWVQGGIGRVVRGGSWWRAGLELRSATRLWGVENDLDRGNDDGFRLGRTLIP